MSAVCDEPELEFLPRLNPVLALHVTERGVLIDGLMQMELLRGIGAETILPALLPLLVGKMTAKEIIDALPGIPEGYIRNILKHLLEWGIVQDGRISQVPMNPIESFLSRHCLIFDGEGPDNRRNQSSRLAACRVHLEVPPGTSTVLTETLVSALQASQFNEVTLGEFAECGDSSGAVAKTTLSIGNRDDRPRPAEFESKRSLLVIQGIRSSVLFCSVKCTGPVCNSCWELSVGEELKGGATAEVMKKVNLVAALLAAELIDIALGAPHALIGRRAREYQLDTLRSTSWQYPEASHCIGCKSESSNKNIQCSADVKISEPSLNIALYYNEILEGRFRLQNEGRPIQGMRQKSAAALQSISIRGTIPLPTSGANLQTMRLRDLVSGGQQCHVKVLSTVHLAALCSFSAGARYTSSSVVIRWAPSGGNLGATNLHIIALTIAGLDPGVYTYDSVTHTLRARKQYNNRDISEISSSLRKCNDVRDAAAFAVYTTRRYLLYPKYNIFSYKLGFLDGGCAVAQARSVIAAVGILASPIESWPDNMLANVIGLGQRDEDVVSILALLPKNSLIARTSRRWYSSTSGVYGSKQRSRLTTAQVADTLARDARTSDVITARIRPSCIQDMPSSTNTIALPDDGDNALVDLENILIHRRSSRRFSAVAVTQREIGTILGSGIREDDIGWPKGRALGITLEIYIICRNVDGIVRGIYRIVQGTNVLERISPAPPDERIVKLYTQSECASAAATAIIVGDIESATSALGAFGYRHLLVRAGALGHSMSLAAIALGLGTVVLAGIESGFARSMLNLSSSTKYILFACAVGHKDFSDRDNLGS